MDPAILESVGRNSQYPNLLKGGVPGHDGSNAGRPANLLRNDWRDKAAGIGAVLIPAMEQIAQAISDCISPDPEKAAQAQETLARFRNAGWTADQLTKSWGKLIDVAMPKQSEITLENSDSLKLAAECYQKGRTEGWTVEQYTQALASMMGIEE